MNDNQINTRSNVRGGEERRAPSRCPLHTSGNNSSMSDNGDAMNGRDRDVSPTKTRCGNLCLCVTTFFFIFALHYFLAVVWTSCEEEAEKQWSIEREYYVMNPRKLPQAVRDEMTVVHIWCFF